MKRRSFLKGVAAIFAAPSLPVKAFASVGGTVVSAPRVTIAASVAHKSTVDLAYIWCRMLVENRSSFKPSMFTSQLGFSKKVADEVLERLIKNDVIRSTLIKGVFEKMDSPIDFVDRSKLKSASSIESELDTPDANYRPDENSKITDFLEYEELRQEEIADVGFLVNTPHQDESGFLSTHAGISTQYAYG